MVFCGVFEQQKIYVVLSASFGAKILDCEALCVGFDSEDVDTDRRILFLEERDLFGLDRVIYSGHVDRGFIFKVVGDPLFAVCRFIQGRQHGPQKTF